MPYVSKPTWKLENIWEEFVYIQMVSPKIGKLPKGRHHLRVIHFLGGDVAYHYLVLSTSWKSYLANLFKHYECLCQKH